MWSNIKKFIQDERGITSVEIFTRNSSANAFRW